LNRIVALGASGSQNHLKPTSHGATSPGR
jgi:hypothetical protein